MLHGIPTGTQQFSSYIILYNSMLKFCYIPSPLRPLILLKSDFACKFVTFILSSITIYNT